MVICLRCNSNQISRRTRPLSAGFTVTIAPDEVSGN